MIVIVKARATFTTLHVLINFNSTPNHDEESKDYQANGPKISLILVKEFGH